MSRPDPSSTCRLQKLARFIQFRSELVIVAVLGLGVVTGATVRQLLSVSPGPSAVIASPDPAAAHRHATRPPAVAPERPHSASPQVID